MDYIKQSMSGIKVHTGFNLETYNQSINKYFNNLLIKHLTTLKGRQEAIKTRYNLQSNVPLYIDRKHCFYQSHHTRDLKNVYINAMNVITIKPLNSKCEITFKNHHKLIVDKPYVKLLRKHERTLSIANDIVNDMKSRLHEL